MFPRFITAFCTALVFLFSLNAHAIESELLAGMKARNIGPAGMSGRISSVASVASNPKIIVVGAASGGVWRSDNSGLTWRPLFDDQSVNSIGAVAINQQHPDIIWVGTGEGATRNSTSIGDGMYRSTDGGETWVHIGLEGSERINRIALHPTNPDIAYVSALGPLWNDGGERGIYRTTDGGQSWELMLGGANARTGGTDIKMDPTNPNKLFAALWEFRRWPYQFKSGGEGSGLFYSIDAGETWTQLTEEDGVPAGNLGRSVFAIAPSDPQRVYALVEAKKSALIRSDDGGKSWKTVNSDTGVAVRPFYYHLLDVDPQDPDTVYNVESRVRRSMDGGKTFSYIEAIDCCAPGQDVHIDTHAWWINPNDPDHMISGNDGGIAVTRDGGDSWRFVENLPLAQFYHVAVDNAQPYNVFGGLQDNGSWRGASETYESGGLRNLHWQEVGFGDGFDTVPDPEIPNTGYAMSQGGNLSRWNLETGEQRAIRPNPQTPDTDLRFNWSSGFAIDPFEPATIYYGSQFLHKSTDRGLSWTVISDDLTTNNPEWQTFRESGGMTYDVTAAENYTTIIAVAPAKTEEGVIWVGTDDGRIHVTRDGGGSWDSVEGRVRGVPDNTWVPMIYPSPHEPGTAFVVFDNHRRGDFKPYVYKTRDYGRRWENLTDDNLKGYALSVLQDPVEPNLLWVGTEFGLFMSLNGGDDWTPFRAGVPTASVMDLAFQARENDLVLGTHGRGIYIIDDVSPLRALAAVRDDAELTILGATDGQQLDVAPVRAGRFWGAGEFVGDNPSRGVVLTLMVKGDHLPHPDADKERARKAAMRDAAKSDDSDEDKKPGKVTVTVTDEQGAVVRTFTTKVQQGVNRVVWPMRADGLPRLPASRKGKDQDLPNGLVVLPGRYTLTVAMGDAEDAVDANVLVDPRTAIGMEAMRANRAMQVELQAMSAKINAAMTEITTAQRDIKTIETLIKQSDSPEDHAALGKMAREATKALGDLESAFRTPPNTVGITYSGDKVGSLLGRARAAVGSTYDAPSPAARAFADIAESALNKAVGDLNAYLSGDFTALREAFAESELGLLGQTPVAM